MKIDKDTWTNNVLESFNLKNEIPISEKLLNKLYSIPNQSFNAESVSFKSILYLAATVLIILGFNLLAWITNHQLSENNGSEVMQYFNYFNSYL